MARWSSSPPPRRIRTGQLVQKLLDALQDLLWLIVLGPEGVEHERSWRKIDRERRR